MVTAPTIENQQSGSDEGRRARRRRELHQRIFETARSLFLEKGFEATTVADIAETADIAQATFFNHFHTKEDVLREMATDVYEHFRALVEEQRQRRVSTRERLLGFAKRGALLVTRAPELTRRVLLEVLHTATPAESGVRLVGIQGYMTELVRDGQAQGDVLRGEKPEFLAEIVVSVIIGNITKWINDPAYPLGESMRRSAAFLGDALAEGRPRSARSD